MSQEEKILAAIAFCALIVAIHEVIKKVKRNGNN